jgi:hypothetical protein
MTANTEIAERIIAFFNDLDARRWQALSAHASDPVTVDYTSLGADRVEQLNPGQFARRLQRLHTGYRATHHAVTNLIVHIDESRAVATHHGSAWHYLPVNSGQHTWTHFGTYEHHLSRTADIWTIEHLAFTLQFAIGNHHLRDHAESTDT